MHQTSTGTKKTKQKAISSNYSEVHLVFFFRFFGACAGLTLTAQNIDRHQKNNKTPNH
jgi:hypothetical protein